jgi:hypothetical protein
MTTQTKTENGGLQEVVLVEEPKTAEVKENPLPNIKEYTVGVGVAMLGGGLLGGMAVGFVPKVLKWDTGIKDILVSGATTLIGGYLLSRWKKDVAMGFVLVGGVLTLVKAVRMVLGKSDALFGTDGVQSDLIYGEDDPYGDLIYDVGQDEIYAEDELFGIGDDPIVPTSDAE